MAKRLRLTEQGANTLSPSIGHKWLDICAADEEARRTWKKIKVIAFETDEPDHRLLQIIGCRPKPEGQPDWVPNRRTKIRIDFDKIVKQDHLASMEVRCAPYLTNWTGDSNRDTVVLKMNKLTNIFIEEALYAQRRVTTTYSVAIKKHSATNNDKLDRLLELLRRKRALDRDINKFYDGRLNQGTTFSTSGRRRSAIGIRLTRKKHKLVKQQNRLIWKLCRDNLIQHADEHTNNTDENQHWQTYHRLSNITDEPPIPPSLFDSTLDGGDQVNLGHNIDTIAAEKFLFIMRQINSTYDSQWSRTVMKISNEEMNVAFDLCKRKSYAGPDGLWFQTFNRIYEIYNEPIKAICSMSFKCCHIPRACQFTRGTIIPKKTAGKFRIVHVSNALMAFIEILALNRL